MAINKYICPWPDNWGTPCKLLRRWCERDPKEASKGDGLDCWRGRQS